MRKWPDGSAYVEAIQNSGNVGDHGIQLGSYERRQNGLPKPYSGGFTTTFHVTTASGAYAVRCFTRGNDDLERRYQAITEFLRFVQHPAFCQAEYLPHGIRVNAAWWPIIKMQWVSGRQINAEVETRLQDSAGLQQLADDFRKLVRALSVLGVAHGDLQHGNIIIANGELRLIDYDGIYLPALAGMLPSEFGHQSYQHPQRKDAPFDGRLDRFSSIVIYTALTALAHDPGLWRRFNNDENLLFRASDFTSHARSELFEAMLANPRSSSLTQALATACDTGVTNVPTLEQVIAGAGLASTPPSYSAAPTATQGPPSSGLPPTINVPVPPPFNASTPFAPSVVPQPFAMPTVRVGAQPKASAAVGQPPAQTNTITQVAPAFCGNCGAALPAAAIFCGRCGSASGPSSAQMGVGAPGARFIGMWNWGACVLYPFWLMTHRRVTLGIVWVFLCVVPIVSLIASVYFGLNGNRIAVLSGRFRDDAEFVGVQNTWRNWAIPSLILSLLVAVGSAIARAELHETPTSYTSSIPLPHRATAVAPRPAAPLAATGDCDAPNRTDISGMEASIVRFHQNITQHNWSDAERYVNRSTYQSADSMQSGYASTVESSPTITGTNGCHVSVTLKFQNNDTPQYCIDEMYDMSYARERDPSWIIQDARSVSERRLCS